MGAIVIRDIEDSVMNRLCERAASNGRTPEDEAKAMLANMLSSPAPSSWDAVNAFRHQLAASGRLFEDSAALVREDRERSSS